MIKFCETAARFMMFIIFAKLGYYVLSILHKILINALGLRTQTLFISTLTTKRTLESYYIGYGIFC